MTFKAGDDPCDRRGDSRVVGFGGDCRLQRPVHSNERWRVDWLDELDE
jgi:hypothetical protein